MELFSTNRMEEPNINDKQIKAQMTDITQWRYYLNTLLNFTWSVILDIE